MGQATTFTLEVPTRNRCEFVDVTRRVQAVVDQAVADWAGVDTGTVICYVPHTTAGITIQENADPDVVHDVLWKLEQLIPKNEHAYRHAEGNTDSHIKASMMGSSVTVLISGGKLVFGTWQGIYFTEFDGPRTRRMIVKVIAD
jgi:secondary thiamine-phosphate synthase enzyme